MRLCKLRQPYQINKKFQLLSENILMMSPDCRIIWFLKTNCSTGMIEKPSAVKCLGKNTTMKKKNLTIIDMNYFAGTALPASDRTFYQWVNCWSILRSTPSNNEYCICGSISIDVDAGRAGANNENLFRVLQIAIADWLECRLIRINMQTNWSRECSLANQNRRARAKI